MDLAAFFRIAIPIALALFCGGLILTIIVIFVGNSFFILKNCFKNEENIIGDYEGSSKYKNLNHGREKRLGRTLPKAS